MLIAMERLRLEFALLANVGRRTSKASWRAVWARPTRASHSHIQTRNLPSYLRRSRKMKTTVLLLHSGPEIFYANGEAEGHRPDDERRQTQEMRSSAFLSLRLPHTRTIKENKHCPSNDSLHPVTKSQKTLHQPTTLSPTPQKRLIIPLSPLPPPRRPRTPGSPCYTTKNPTPRYPPPPSPEESRRRPSGGRGPPAIGRRA